MHFSPGAKNTGVGCHFLLQGIFLTQGSNLGLLHCRQILYQLSYKGGTGYLGSVPGQGLKISLHATAHSCLAEIKLTPWFALSLLLPYLLFSFDICFTGIVPHRETLVNAENWWILMKRHLLPGRKAMTNLESTLKSRDITLPTKVRSQSYGFSSGHVWMWELDYKESWALKNWCFWIVVLEKTLESPLDCKKIQPVHHKGNQPWIFIGRTDAEAETSTLWPPDV